MYTINVNNGALFYIGGKIEKQAYLCILGKSIVCSNRKLNSYYRQCFPIKGMFLSYYVYMVWEVKNPLSRKQYRLWLSIYPHLISESE
jgi:hypothetical protein